jgi:hypothetical protein
MRVLDAAVIYHWGVSEKVQAGPCVTPSLLLFFLEYAALGIEEFVFSGYPHLEEAYWLGEGVLPELRRRAQAAASPVLATAAGQPGG